jgi:hypothetical protein
MTSSYFIPDPRHILMRKLDESQEFDIGTGPAICSFAAGGDVRKYLLSS